MQKEQKENTYLFIHIYIHNLSIVVRQVVEDHYAYKNKGAVKSILINI